MENDSVCNRHSWRSSNPNKECPHCVQSDKDRNYLIGALKIILVYCETPEASGYDDIFLARLKKELEPIKKECRTTLENVGEKIE